MLRFIFNQVKNNVMKYLITKKGEEPFITDYFNFNENYEDDMIVYDLSKSEYYDGDKWKSIDHNYL